MALPIRLDPPAATELVGEADEPAAAAVPEMTYEARAEDFSEDHPELPGFPISFNTLLLVFTLDTTVGQANAVLTEIEAEVVGDEDAACELVALLLSKGFRVIEFKQVQADLEQLFMDVTKGDVQ